MIIRMGRDYMIDQTKIAAELPVTGASVKVRLRRLLENIVDISPAQDRLIGALQLNSLSVQAGDVFVALPGFTADGRDYIDGVIERGVSVVLFEKQGSDRQDGLVDQTLLIGIEGLKGRLGEIASRYYGNPSQCLNVIGLTGTNGKTTIAYLVAQALTLCGVRCGYSGTIGSGTIDNLNEVELTTADAITLQRQLAGFVAESVDALAIEVSSHGLDQGRSNAVEFQTAVFTNLTQDHLDYHQTMEAYAAAKQKLFEFSSVQSAVINSDDVFGKDLVALCEARNQQVFSYGLESGELRARELALSDSGLSFVVDIEGVATHFESSLIGQVNLYNLLATIGVLLANNLESAQIKKVLPEIKAPPGRMELFRLQHNQPGVIVDFAHTPDALERALQSLRPLCRGRLFVVFGCGGDRDQGKRAQMGTIADRLADQIVVTDDNPRTEPSDEIVAQILQGINRQVLVEHDRKKAIRTAVELADGNDLVLVAGKGHEQTQSIGGQKVPMNDRKMVLEILQAAKS